MLENRITLSLQATFILITLGLVHLTGSVLGRLGILSDLFVVIGAIQTVRFFINEDLRFDVSEFLGEFLQLSDVAEFIADKLDEVIVDEVTEEEFEAYLASFKPNAVVQTDKEEILDERKV